MQEIVQEEAATKEEMTSVSKRVHSMDTKMTSVSNKVHSMDTKMNKIDQDVKMNGWRFLGVGYIYGQDASSNEGHVPLSQCLEICERKHSSDKQWNGIMWDHSPSGNCFCRKNDKGHIPDENSQFMHFFK